MPRAPLVFEFLIEDFFQLREPKVAEAQLQCQKGLGLQHHQILTIWRGASSGKNASHQR